MENGRIFSNIRHFLRSENCSKLNPELNPDFDFFEKIEQKSPLPAKFRAKITITSDFFFKNHHYQQKSLKITNKLNPVFFFRIRVQFFLAIEPRKLILRSIWKKSEWIEWSEWIDWVLSFFEKNIFNLLSVTFFRLSGLNPLNPHSMSGGSPDIYSPVTSYKLEQRKS